jgi:hypothetical protein
VIDDRPVPVDDGAANHLHGASMPSTALPSTLGGLLDIRDAARDLLVVYVYPRTGRPGEPLPAGWDEIPGARGCTLQSCAFRDHVSELAAHGAAVIGVSAQSPAELWFRLPSRLRSAPREAWRDSKSGLRTTGFGLR